VRLRAVLLRHAAPRQPRARPHLARCDENRAHVVPRDLAKSARHCPALRLVHRPSAERILGALSRRTFRMPAWEAPQLLIGPTLPPLLAAHFVGTWLAHDWYGQEDAYHRVALVFWELRPSVGLRQSIVLTVAWLHDCIGLHFWLRLRSWYPRAAPV